MLRMVRRKVGLKVFGLLLLFMAGCVASPPRLNPEWYGQGIPRPVWHVLGSGRAVQQVVDVDFEIPTPQREEELRQRGVQVPRVSRSTVDPREHRDFIDNRVTAVGFGITAGGYLLYCEGVSMPVLVPEAYVDLTLTSAEPLNPSIYPDRESARASLPRGAAGSGPPRYTYHRAAGGALIAPLVFSPATTPRIARTMLEVRKHLSESVTHELRVLLLNLAGSRVLQGVFSRVVRVGTEPVPPAVVPESRPVGQTARAPVATEPLQRPAVPVPTPAEPALAPPAPAPAPGTLAPSPGLVQALTGKNATPQVAPRPRLPLDVAANPDVPKPLATNRKVGPSATQNAQVQADINYLRSIGAKNIRVNQQQLTLENGQRVGINRPDVQFDLDGRRYHVEYDTPTSGRGPAHRARATANDPNSETILLIVP